MIVDSSWLFPWFFFTFSPLISTDPFSFSHLQRLYTWRGGRGGWAWRAFQGPGAMCRVATSFSETHQPLGCSSLFRDCQEIFLRNFSKMILGKGEHFLLHCVPESWAEKNLWRSEELRFSPGRWAKNAGPTEESSPYPAIWTTSQPTGREFFLTKHHGRWTILKTCDRINLTNHLTMSIFCGGPECHPWNRSKACSHCPPQMQWLLAPPEVTGSKHIKNEGKT